MDSNNLIISLSVITLFGAYYYKKYKMKRTRAYRVNPYLMERSQKGRFASDVSKIYIYIIPRTIVEKLSAYFVVHGYAKI